MSLAPPMSENTVGSLAIIGNESRPDVDDGKPRFTDFIADDIQKGHVVWQAPENLGDIGWTSPDVYQGTYTGKDGESNGVHYAKVGTITQGKYANADVLIVFSWFVYADDFPNRSPNIEHYLRLPGKTIFLPSADTPNGGRKLAELPVETAPIAREKKLAFHVPNEVIESNLRFVELAQYPAEFMGDDGRALFARNEYEVTAFFSGTRMKPAFVHPTWGQVWMTDDASQDTPSFELNSYLGVETLASGLKSKTVRVKKYFEPMTTGGIYLKRPDGIAVSYHLKFDIFDTFDRMGILQATWNDGTRNQDTFEEYAGGCGATSYAYDVTSSVDAARDLVVIGKTDKGDNLYGYKDTTTEALQTAYGYVKDGYTMLKEKSLSLEEFLELRPTVFWRDSLGRLLKFNNAQLMPVAECGKPVVYLYPEKTTPVSVQVFPDEGVRISEPAYADGWNIIAEPNGNLTNLSDGKSYRSLFWEGGSSVLYQPSDRGFVVARDDLETFFDEKLLEVGLLGQEITDFNCASKSPSVSSWDGGARRLLCPS